MNRASIIALVIGAMLFGCGAGMVAHEAIESEAVAYEGQTWEYAHVKGSSLSFKADESTLAEMGQKGWELVLMSPSGQHYWFKRPLP